MKVSKGKKYKTVNGTEVRIYCTDGGGQYPVHGAYKINDRWRIECWTKEGRHLRTELSCLDLVI